MPPPHDILCTLRQATNMHFTVLNCTCILKKPMHSIETSVYMFYSLFAGILKWNLLHYTVNISCSDQHSNTEPAVFPECIENLLRFGQMLPCIGHWHTVDNEDISFVTAHTLHPAPFPSDSNSSTASSVHYCSLAPSVKLFSLNWTLWWSHHLQQVSTVLSRCVLCMKPGVFVVFECCWMCSIILKHICFNVSLSSVLQFVFSFIKRVWGTGHLV